MKITILDGNALNPGDLSWKPLEQFGEVTVYDRTKDEEVVSRIADSDAILLNKINITKSAVINKLLCLYKWRCKTTNLTYHKLCVCFICRFYDIFNICLDLNGNSITGSHTSGRALTISNGQTVNITKLNTLNEILFMFDGSDIFDIYVVNINSCYRVYFIQFACYINLSGNCSRIYVIFFH